ncbi:MAG: response regulator [Deltaproteobacteria bacterium]|nr:response regulator [Deltaproteobacteria bacterium]
MAEKIKILIVDDIQENRYLLLKTLEWHGYTVKTAGNGVEALEMAQKEMPDVIISDVLMPVMDGFQLCRNVKKDKKLKGIPVIFYSATYSDKESKKLALDLGAAAYILKPIEPGELVRIIEDAVGKQKKEGGKPVKKPLEEKVYMKLYNERLVRKLEKKMLDLERSEKDAKHLNTILATILDVNRMIIKENDLPALLQKTCDRLTGESTYAAAWFGTMKEEGEGFDKLAVSGFGKESSRFRKEMMAGNFVPCVKKAMKAGSGSLVMDRRKDCAACLFKDEHPDGETLVIRSRHADIPSMLLAVSSGSDLSVNGKKKILINGISDSLVTGIYKLKLEGDRRQAKQELEQSYEKLQVTLEGTINALAAATEWRDPYTAGHQQRVAELARAIAEEMNLSEEQIREIHMSALIHDIGKINVPAEILSKPGQLSEFEFKIIQTHPQIGYDILKEIEFPWPIARIVLQHHERMNGSGYPQGLSGKDILLEARILAVADVVEAMSSHRPYRPALGIDRALEEISQNKGILYDPEVADACLSLFTEKDFKF